MAAPPGLRPIGPATYELGADYRPGMRVPVRVFAGEKLLAEMDEQVFVQAANVATLPGIVEASFCMPDAHWGYGFPIGGVAAVDVETGVISPGGIGFDINCGVRLVTTNLTWPTAEAAPWRADGRAGSAGSGWRGVAGQCPDQPGRVS